MKESFDVRPILATDLPQLAEFLHRWRANRGEDVAHASIKFGIERRLRWLLQDNPFGSGTSHGYCVWDTSGAIRGADVAFPSPFIVNGTRLIGYCSGAFFVEPAARTLGTFLIKNYLSTGTFPFFFATTCNSQSGAIWKALGGKAVPNHDREYMFPFRLDVVLNTVLNGRSKALIRASLRCARALNPLAQMLAKRSSGLRIRESCDWEKLSTLFYQNALPNVLTTDRTPRWLDWRYGERGPNAARIYTFCDKRGHEGWFVLGDVVRGYRAPLRGQILLDAVWPRHSMSFENLFPAILRLAASDGDALFLQPRAKVDYARCSRFIFSQRLPPRIFVVSRKAQVPPISNFDFVPADGDSAFRISGWPAALEQRISSGSTTAARQSESFAPM